MNEEQKELCEAAAAIVKESASLYSPKGRLYFPVAIDRQGNEIQEIESDEQDTVCEDCYAETVRWFRAQRKAGTFNYQCSDLAGIQLNEHTSPETDDFKYCGFCQEIIYTGVLHTFSQEIDHWIEVDVDDFPRQMNFPKDAWLVHELLTSADAQQRHPDELEILAHKILLLCDTSLFN